MGLFSSELWRTTLTRLSFWHRHKNPSVGSSESGSKPKPPTKVFPSGIKLLYKPELDNAVVDIIFIHGLTGDREQTWKANDVADPWPQTLLPPKISKARILTFGYDAYVANWKSVVSTNRISNHSMNLLTSIATYRERDETDKRPIIFVCHSLGGLVCEDALVQAQSDPKSHLRDILECTRGIIFLGTPHQGSALAPWAEALSRSIGLLKQTNSKIVQVLKNDSEILSQIQNRFHGMITYRHDHGEKPIEITCFYEELPLPVVGIVVPQQSAMLPGYTYISIRENHRNMTKFTNEEHPGFIAVAGELRRWVKALSTANPLEQLPIIPEPKKLFIVPYTSNPSFTGQADVLAKVKKHFDPGLSPQNKTGVQERAALFGLSGVGKTQIALAYAYQVNSEYKDVSVLWVDASNTERFRESYHQIAQSCQIPGYDDPNVNVLELVKAWLEDSHLQRWLMVIDNANDTEMFFSTSTALTTLGSSSEVASEGNLSQYIPNCSQGSILVTTRNKTNGSKLTNDGEVIGVEKMSQWDCIELIRKQLQDETIEAQDMIQLAIRLMNSPRSIIEATAFIRENKMTIGEHIELLDQNDGNLVELLSQPSEEEREHVELLDQNNGNLVELLNQSSEEEGEKDTGCKKTARHSPMGVACTEVQELGSLSPHLLYVFNVLRHESHVTTRAFMTEAKLQDIVANLCVVNDSGNQQRI